MILLEYTNRIIEEYVTARVENGVRTLDDITLADFDGVEFHISTPDQNNKGVVNFSIRWACLPDLLHYGGSSDLQKIYGPMLAPAAEEGYGVTLTVDFVNLPAQEASDKLATKIANLKRNVFAAPFKQTFQSIVERKAGNQIVKISYRTGEAVYLKPEGDRCIVIFEISFRDPDDGVMSKVFLQEFVDARRNMRGAPSVNFYLREPPLELAGYGDLQDVRNNGFVSFVLFEQHMAARNVFKTINLIQTFRDYLHYHIKCSKAYMHNRMRARVASWLQVLNRARPEPFEAKEKKKMSGRTFVRK